MDKHIQQLADFFAHNPVWVSAAQAIDKSAQSKVYFSHQPGLWCLKRQEQGSSLLATQTVSNPDFALTFTPTAIERLITQNGDIADFAITLFELIAAQDPTIQVKLSIIAPFPQLLSHGYLKLLLQSGPKLLAYIRTQGVSGISDIYRLQKAWRQKT